MNIQLLFIFLFSICFNVYSQHEEILIKLIDIKDKKFNILTENGMVSIDEKVKEIESGNPEAMAVGINLYEANLMEKYLKGVTNKELLSLFIEEYSLAIIKEKDLVEKMTLKNSAKKALYSLLKDEEKLIQQLSKNIK